MGQRPRQPHHNQPPCVSPSGAPEDQATPTTGEIQLPVLEELFPDPQFVDVHLINVDGAILSASIVGEQVQVRGAAVFSKGGRIGDIPHIMRSSLKAGGFRSGFLLSVQPAVVRLYAVGVSM